MSEEQVLEEPLLEELMELVGEVLDKPKPSEEEGTVENLIKSAEPKEVPVDEELPKVIQEEEPQVGEEPQKEPLEEPLEELSELDQANVTIAKLTEALNKPLQSTSIPEITPTVAPTLQDPTIITQPVPQVQSEIPPIQQVQQPTVAATSQTPPVQQTIKPTLPQDVFEQLMTNPEAFQSHIQEIANLAVQQSREKILLELGPMVDLKMNARASVENQVKEFFADAPQQDIVTHNHSPLVVMQAEIVQQQNPNTPLAQVLQHSTNMVRNQVGLPLIDYTISQAVAPQTKIRTPRPEQRFAAPTTRRTAPQQKTDPNSIVNQILDMAPTNNGIDSLLS